MTENKFQRETSVKKSEKLPLPPEVIAAMDTLANYEIPKTPFTDEAKDKAIKLYFAQIEMTFFLWEMAMDSDEYDDAEYFTNQAQKFQKARINLLYPNKDLARDVSLRIGIQEIIDIYNAGDEDEALKRYKYLKKECESSSDDRLRTGWAEANAVWKKYIGKTYDS